MAAHPVGFQSTSAKIARCLTSDQFLHDAGGVEFADVRFMNVDYGIQLRRCAFCTVDSVTFLATGELLALTSHMHVADMMTLAHASSRLIHTRCIYAVDMNMYTAD